MIIKPKIGGYLKETRSPEDRPYNLIVNHLKPVDASINGYDNRKWCSPIEAQLQLSSCAANATVGALEMLQIKEGLQYNDLSRLFLYYNSRLMHQAQNVDDGTYITMAFGTLSSIGTCTEKKWPYDVSKVLVRPTWGSYREAYVNKISAYYRLSDDTKTRHEQIRHACEHGHPIVFGTLIDEDFMNVGSDGIIAMPKQIRQNMGGHAMMICGYTDSGYYIVRNSWGQRWAHNGYCYISPAYLDATDAGDFWCPTVTVNV